MFLSAVLILYIIEKSSGDSNDHALFVAASHNEKAEIWNLGLPKKRFGLPKKDGQYNHGVRRLLSRRCPLLTHF